MTPLILDGHYLNPVQVDHCAHCKLFWFDFMETAALAQNSLETMFALIGQGPLTDTPMAENAACPRCQAALQIGADITRFGRTRHYRCPAKHGHAVTHIQFLSEKGLLRNPTDIEFLAPQNCLINTPCPSCGAPMDALQDGRCPYCRAPVIVLDLKKARSLLHAQALPPLVDPKAN